MPFTHTALYGPCTPARMVEVGISAGRTDRISPWGVLRPPQIRRMVCFSVLAYWKSSGVMRRMPSTKMSGKNDFAGGGEINNTQSLSGRAAVLVTDVLPNGNLVIEGVRVITFSGETQYVVLHGLVRADDVTSANTVDSTNVADVRLEFISEGALTDAQKRGWITKIYDKLRPY